jgi:MFS transporter, DHA1 family, multidrug resistance protein
VGMHVAIGYGFMVGAGGLNLAYHAWFPPALPWSVLPLLFYAFGMSLVAPMVTLLVMDLFPRLRGLVASCQSFTQTMLGAFAAGVGAPALSHNVVALAAGQFVCAALGLVLWLAGRSYHAARTRARINAWETVPME